jgi:hypothetical protein
MHTTCNKGLCRASTKQLYAQGLCTTGVDPYARHQMGCKAHLEHFREVLIFPQVAHEGSGVGNGPPLVHINQFILLCRDIGDCLCASTYVSSITQICCVQDSCNHVMMMLVWIDLAGITMKDSMKVTQQVRRGCKGCLRALPV